MKRIAQITLMALIISIVQPAELQAWSLSTNQKILGAAAVVAAALLGLYWWNKATEVSPSTQQGSDTPYSSSSSFWYHRTPSIFDGAENRPARAQTESDTSPSGPIPTTRQFNFANNTATAQFILQKVKELIESNKSERLYLSHYNFWGIRLSITKINDRTLKVSFSTWKTNGEYLNNLCVIFNKKGTGWRLNLNSIHAIPGTVSTDMQFSTNTDKLLASFTQLCASVKERLRL